MRQFLHTCAQRLLFHQCRITTFRSDLPPVLPLRDLVLQNLLIPPTALEYMLSAPALGKLTSLVLDNVDCYDAKWHQYNFARLSDLLEKNLPDLETFTFVNSHLNKHDRIVEFGSFKGLGRLKILQVDLILMVDHGVPSEHDDHKVPLPPSLETLELIDCKSHDLDLFRQRKDGEQVCLDSEVGPRDACHTVWNLLTGSIPAPALRSLVVNVAQQSPGSSPCGREHLEVSGETMSQLKTAVDTAAARGLSLRILEQTGPFDRLRKLPDNADSLL